MWVMCNLASIIHAITAMVSSLPSRSMIVGILAAPTLADLLLMAYGKVREIVKNRDDELMLVCSCDASRRHKKCDATCAHVIKHQHVI